jgi:hypothetical protein
MGLSEGFLFGLDWHLRAGPPFAQQGGKGSMSKGGRPLRRLHENFSREVLSNLSLPFLFKSRIQLALRYPNLDEAQRREIWCSIFRMLRDTNGRVDMGDLEMNVNTLTLTSDGERDSSFGSMDTSTWFI